MNGTKYIRYPIRKLYVVTSSCISNRTAVRVVKTLNAMKITYHIFFQNKFFAVYAFLKGPHFLLKILLIELQKHVETKLEVKYISKYMFFNS